jgi:hypothetical protein
MEEQETEREYSKHNPSFFVVVVVAVVVVIGFVGFYKYLERNSSSGVTLHIRSDQVWRHRRIHLVDHDTHRQAHQLW